MSFPSLQGAARDAVECRGSHVQILASAGSGKTEVLAQRIASLVADGTPGAAIVAFTFTDRAAAELRHRVTERARAWNPSQDCEKDPIAGMQIGTIHGYCHELLQRFESDLELHEIVDTTRQFAFLTRVGREFGVTPAASFGSDQNLRVSDFLRAADIIENELIDPSTLPGQLRFAYIDYLEALDRYRFITYGQLIVRALKTLSANRAAAAYVDGLQHIIVDEYQDINPAQVELIRSLSRSGAEVSVVGDDDQAIYQWRGSDIRFIRDFALEFQPLAQFELLANHRSAPQIVDIANQIAASIDGRIEKTMRPVRPDAGRSVASHLAETEAEEASWIAREIGSLYEDGVRYRDVAVLARSRAAFPPLVAALRERGIPVRLNGWTGLFQHPVAIGLGKAMAWLGDLTWREVEAEESGPSVDELASDVVGLFGLPATHSQPLAELLAEQRSAIEAGDVPLDLVGIVYALLARLGFTERAPTDPDTFISFGVAARFTTLVGDYEAVNRRARSSSGTEGGQIGGSDRGQWYVRGLGYLILGHAFGTYAGFDGRTHDGVDAVDVGTVHGAKGLEWPVVFVASVTDQRFPSSRSGRKQTWAIPRDSFAADRYEGSEADERRLFYVAITRARERLYVTGHRRRNDRRVRLSPYYSLVAAASDGNMRLSEVGALTTRPRPEEEMELTVGSIADYRSCPRKYEFRHVLGFTTSIATELGYGRAVHSSIRRVAEQAEESSDVPDEEIVEKVMDADFYLPFANKPAHHVMRESAKKLVKRYFEEHGMSLGAPIAIERPVKLRRDTWSLSGRIDALFGSEPGGTILVDFKSSVEDDSAIAAELQLLLYAGALRAEGVTVDRAIIHDLKESQQRLVDVSPERVSETLSEVDRLVTALLSGGLQATPGKVCKSCDFRPLCSDATRQRGKSTRKSSGESAKVRSGSL